MSATQLHILTRINAAQLAGNEALARALMEFYRRIFGA
jgi:hypothetical protein